MNGGQIEAGIIKSLNSSATAGTILNLQQGELHVGGSGSNARFLFDNNQLRVSASNFFVGSESFISGSGANVEISSSGFHLKPTGDAIFSGSITANQGTIGGFSILENELSIDNIKLSSLEKGLVISSSQGVGKVLISSGSLSGVGGSQVNLFTNASFENANSNFIISTSNHQGWFFENDSTNSDVEELWNSGSISMSVATSDAGDGSKHIRINVNQELGPAGTGAEQNPQ